VNQVGVAKYRKMRAGGGIAVPAPVLDSAESFSIPSRDPGRNITCRILRPQTGNPLKGVFMHIQGGGWVLASENNQDPVLQQIANAIGVLCISIRYRLAPEDPFPAGPEDCYDAAKWLVKHAEKKFGAPLSFIGGESAGAHLSVLTALRLLHHQNTRFSPDFHLRGLLLHYGIYDLTLTPSVYNFHHPHPQALDRQEILRYIHAFLPRKSVQDMKHPSISPLYADLVELKKQQLPAALFTCGTADPLLDDTVFMGAKWMAAGGEAQVKIIPGALHGYINFPPKMMPLATEGLDTTLKFMRGKLK
jgi:acetyl esterase/lipase